MRLFIFLSLLIANTALAAKSATANKSNPDISVSGLFIYRTSNEGNLPEKEATNGIALQELELRFASNIDSNFRGDVTFAVKKENGSFIIEPEEAFVETLSLPGVSVKAGKFFLNWGRHNTLHAHSFPFIDGPLSRESLFGEEGLNENGLAVSYLAPLPWYTELVVQAVNGDNVHVFGSNSQDDIAGVFFLKNLFDFGSSTLELDLGFGTGHDINNQRNSIYNATTAYKWKGSDRTSFSWTTEYHQAEKRFDDSGTAQGRVGVLSTWAQYQFAKHYWVQARQEWVEFITNSATGDTKKSSALLGWVPSEFSALRLQYDSIDEAGTSEIENRVTLQLNVSIGAHPAHAY